MFGLFKKKQDTAQISDKVWINTSARNRGLVKDIKAAVSQQQTVSIFYFFKDSKKMIELILNEVGIEFSELENSNLSTSVVIIPASELEKSMSLQGKFKRRAEKGNGSLFFLEHYPMLSVEQQFFEVLSLQTVHPIKAVFYLAMDGPLLQSFGGDRLIGTMQSMGISEDECTEHNMITKSIERAQKKLEKKLDGNEIKTHSEEEWYKTNQIS